MVKFRPGDRVIITDDYMKMFGPLRGDLGTVKAVEYHHVLVLMDNPRTDYNDVFFIPEAVMLVSDWEKLPEIERLLF